MSFGSAGMTSSWTAMIFPDDGQFQRSVSRYIAMISVPQLITILGSFRQGYMTAMSYPLFQHRAYMIWKGVSLIGFCP